MPLLLASSIAVLKTFIDTDGEVESIHDSHLFLESERTRKITVCKFLQLPNLTRTEDHKFTLHVVHFLDQKGETIKT